MSTAVKMPAHFDAVTNHLTAAMLANRSNGLYCALEAIESLVVFIAADLALGHKASLRLALPLKEDTLILMPIIGQHSRCQLLARLV
jgi:hypothetical protein